MQVPSVGQAVMQVPQVTFNSVNDYCEPPPPPEDGQEEEEDEDGDWTGSDDDTIDEDVDYECKVEVKQNQTSIPTSVRTIETKVSHPTSRKIWSQTLNFQILILPLIFCMNL